MLLRGLDRKHLGREARQVPAERDHRERDDSRPGAEVDDPHPAGEAPVGREPREEAAGLEIVDRELVREVREDRVAAPVRDAAPVALPPVPALLRHDGPPEPLEDRGVVERLAGHCRDVALDE